MADCTWSSTKLTRRPAGVAEARVTVTVAEARVVTVDQNPARTPAGRASAR